MCECTDTGMDIKTPRNVYLSAFYKRSFAYHTVKNRMPVIVTQIIDTLSRTKHDVIEQFGDGAREDLKKVISELSKLKYEIQTNKPLNKLSCNEPDAKIYNELIDKQAAEEGEASYFNTIWLLTECYMYRRIKEIFTLTESLKDFDYFGSLKRDQFNTCQNILKTLCDYNVTTLSSSKVENLESELHRLIKMDLWGNKGDLSISLGKVVSQSHDIDRLDQYILVDDSLKFIKDLVEIAALELPEYIDIVLDNSGYELLMDLCLMTAITAYFKRQDGSGRFKVRFHVKSIPWFISDVTVPDFNWTLDQLVNHEDSSINSVGHKWQEFLTDGTWEVMPHLFWTLPCEYKYMPDYAPDLYELLSSSALVIFKGDLNYRKVFGEKNWDPTTDPKVALQGLDLRLILIRTIKADIVCGLAPGTAEQCEKVDPKWMENGDYGLIQYIPAKSIVCCNIA